MDSTQAPARRNRRFERPRERVLEEAWKLLVERGMSDFTLAELGRRVDTSAGHLLYYFGSKDDLLLDVLRTSEQHLLDQLAILVETEMPLGALLHDYTRLYLPAGRDDPRWLVWLELYPRALRVDSLVEPHAELARVWHDQLAAVFQRAGIPHDEAVVAARRVAALLDGLSIAIMMGEEGMTIDAAWGHVRATLPLELNVQ